MVSITFHGILIKYTNVSIFHYYGIYSYMIISGNPKNNIDNIVWRLSDNVPNDFYFSIHYISNKVQITKYQESFRCHFNHLVFQNTLIIIKCCNISSSLDICEECFNKIKDTSELFIHDL